MKEFVVKRVKKIRSCEKTAGLRCGTFSDLNSACSKVLVELVPIKTFQFQDTCLLGYTTLQDTRFLGSFRGHSKRPIFEINIFWSAEFLKLGQVVYCTTKNVS